MLFFTFFASPNISWMLFWLGAGFLLSERHPLTFVIPFATTLMGYTDLTVWYIFLIWLCDFADKPLFTSQDYGKGRINVWLEKIFPNFGPFKQKREEEEFKELWRKDHPEVVVENKKKDLRMSPKKLKDKFMKI